MAREGIKEGTCKYCHNFYSTLCPKCGVYTEKGVPDYFCHGGKKEVQKNWKNYLKVKDMLEQCITEELMRVKEQKQKMTKKDELRNRVLNGGRGSGQSLRLLVDIYENQIADLEKEKCELLGIIQGKDKAIQDLQKENAELKARFINKPTEQDYISAMSEIMELENGGIFNQDEVMKILKKYFN